MRTVDQIESMLAEAGVVGASVAVLRDRDVMWSGHFGCADVKRGNRPDDDTIYRMASCTKTFTGTAIMQLLEQGKLGLNDRVIDHIPEFAKVQNPFGPVGDLTIRHLMTHHSGLVFEPPMDYRQTLKFPSTAELLAQLPNTAVAIPPESAFKYSNIGIILLGEVISRRAGRPYIEYMEAEVLKPLGMTSSVYILSDELRPRMATGYTSHLFEDEATEAPHVLRNGVAPAGGLYSTLRDLIKFIQLQFRTDAPKRQGAQVISGASLKAMHRTYYVDEGWQLGNALTWLVFRRGNAIILGHGGGAEGFTTFLGFDPKHRIGLVLLTNNAGHSTTAMGTRILELLHDEYPPQQARLGHAVPTPRDWKRLLGRYGTNKGLLMGVEFRGGKLMLTSPDEAKIGMMELGISLAPAELIPTGDPNVFRPSRGPAAGEELAFKVTEAGEVLGFTLRGALFPRQVAAVR
jgi:CubicO group peptidase (beta-lactamase class C family)